MKLLIITFIFLWFGNPVSIIKSTKQEWKGGQGASQGVNYKIQVVVKKSATEIMFNSAVINGNNSNIKVYKNNKLLEKIGGFNRNDTLIIITSITYKIEDRKSVKHPDDVVIKYRYKNRNMQLKVKQFDKLKTIMYP